MSTDYHDRWITIDDAGLSIRAYYFPWGTKRIPLEQIRQIERVSIGLATGRGRIWGTGNLTASVWASLDPRRPSKKVGFLVSSGGRVRALITPEDPDAAEQALRSRVEASVFPTGTRPAPLV